MVAEQGHFKGNKVLILKRDLDDKYGFTFGYGKAKLILEHLDDIKAFVEDVEQKGNMDVI